MQKNSVPDAPPLISFCVPTYNGMRYLPELTASLLPQLDERTELVFSDDGSTDGTFGYLQSLAATHTRVRVFRNESNLGMDANFHQSVKHAQGAYVWLSGQDDRFGPQACATLQRILKERPEVDFVYFNYRQYFDEPEPHYGTTCLPISQDIYTETAEAYFAHVDRAPSFLPATVMRRSAWTRTDLTPYYGTLYVQVGCWLANAKNAHVHIVADPTHVDCRCPLDSWKYTDGAMWYNTKIGALAAYHIALRDNPDAYPRAVYEGLRDAFLAELPFDGVFFKARGMRLGARQKELTRIVFGGQAWRYRLYVLPLVHMPAWMARGLAWLYGFPFFKQALRAARRLLPFKKPCA